MRRMRHDNQRLAEANLLRMLADIVERHGLDTAGLDRSLRGLRRTSPREVPYILLRTAMVLRGLSLSPAELSAWLRAAADLYAERVARGIGGDA